MRKRIRFSILISFLILGIVFGNQKKENENFVSYPMVSLTSYLDKMKDTELEEAEYQKLYLQTGLGKRAIEELIEQGEEKKLLEYQKNFFAEKIKKSRNITPVTTEEKLCDEKGIEKAGFELASVQDGDIFITKSTQTLGWNHGHAAIVIDAEKGKTLEALALGENTTEQSVEKWKYYPEFIQLRLKQEKEDRKTGEKAADFAEKWLWDRPYHLFAGMFGKRTEPNRLTGTQCAHLVWYAYDSLGYDLDSDGGWIVTPKDLANSPYLEVIQIYGVNPFSLWS